MRILNHDTDEFSQRFPGASAFLNAATLRQEYWDLCSLNQHTHWQLHRLDVLRQCPACHEAWFVLAVGRTFGQWPDGKAEVEDVGL